MYHLDRTLPPCVVIGGPLPGGWKGPKAPGLYGPQDGNQVIGDVELGGTYVGWLGWRLQAVASARGVELCSLS